MSDRLAVKFTSRADGHVEQAGRWWQQNRLKAPEALAENLEAALDLVSRQPQVGAIARNVRLRDVRRVYLNRVGYYLSGTSGPRL
ncbi:MAG TPA: type II toxin-antitoxin system RelE/ParE family toxin [Thermoanaerobaculia bacterium]|nr:type II toxin-antitoxin system RelE/ParE family toxin [Thermoanaerobaculia bacterium]